VGQAQSVGGRLRSATGRVIAAAWKAVGMGLTVATLILLVGGPRVQAAAGVQVVYRTRSGAPLSSLLAGKAGSGYLIYYLPSRGPRHASLVVLLENQPGDVEADVFQAPPGRHWLNPRHLPRTPALRLTAVGGWWVRHGIPNDSLNVTVYAHIQGIEPPGFYRYVHTAGPLFYIESRADADGIPVWVADWRLVATPGHGFPSFGYVQRECRTPLTRQPSLSPEWPYVTNQGFFAPLPERIPAPIVVNFRSAKVTTYADLLSNHFENCMYVFNSYAAVPLHGPGTPDFESPWGFYDLSGQGHGYPNLIVHTFYSYPGEADLSQLLQANGPFPQTPAAEDIRYSWADHVGNLLFNFKVDLYGHYAYTGRVALASGQLTVTAPSYQAWPNWVMSKAWPIAAFVEPQFDNEQTSEGIYAWNADAVGTRYDYGLSTTPNLSSFATLPLGYRGEVRAGAFLPVVLYASPVDGRLHLLDARQGLWNLGDGTTLVERNLNGGLYLDEWERVFHPTPVVAPEVSRAADRQAVAEVGSLAPVVQSRLLALPDQVVLVADASGVLWLHTPYRANVLELSPPTSPATWRRFRTAAAPWMAGKSPYHLAEWVAGWPGDRVLLPGAKLLAVRVGRDAFAVEMAVAQTAPPLPGSSRMLTPGVWVVTAGPGRLAVAQARPGTLKGTVSRDNGPPGVLSFHVYLHNGGTAPWTGTVTLRINGQSVSRWHPEIWGGGTWTAVPRWLPPVSMLGGHAHLALTVDGRVLWQRLMTIDVPMRPAPTVLFAMATPASWLDVLMALTIGALLTAVWTLWKRVAA
jgi:hypothetical protein